MRPIVLAMTGGSGAIYGARLLQMLLAADREIHLVISPAGAQVIRQELGLTLPPVDLPIGATHLPQQAAPGMQAMQQVPPTFRATTGATHLTELVGVDVGRQSTEDEKTREAAVAALSAGRLKVHGHRDYFTPIASGSFLTSAMVICPCSGGTLSSIVRSAGSNLIERAAEVHLKERRKLIIVNRETPLSTFQLENMLRASQAGIVVLPAMPGWYHGVQNTADLVDFVVARILDQLDVPHRLMNRWQSPDLPTEE